MNRRAFLSSFTVLAVPGCLGVARTNDGNSTTVQDMANDCPQFEDTEETICYSQTDPESAEIYVEPSTETATVPGEIQFRLHNNRESKLWLNPAEWKLLRRDADGWQGVATGPSNLTVTPVEPSESYEWTIKLRENDETQATTTEDLRTVGVSAGTYAFGAIIDDDEQQIAYATSFTVK